jgi:hypothetical protein
MRAPLSRLLLLVLVTAVLVVPACGGKPPAAAPPAAPTSAPAPVSREATPAAAPAPLAVTDVRAFLDAFTAANAQSGEATQNEAANRWSAAVSSEVDVPAFVAASLRQTPLRWPIRSTNPRAVTGAEREKLIAEAVATYESLVTSKGTTEALALVAASDYGVVAPEPLPASQKDLLLLVGQGLVPLQTMFGEDAAWSYAVTGVSLQGTDTARVTYRLTPPPGAHWHFARDSFDKVLRFSQGADGRWRAAGWSNYQAFLRDVQAAIVPKNAPDAPSIISY